jgi:hypothetical protein
MMNMYVILMIMLWDVNACLTPRGVTTVADHLESRIRISKFILVLVSYGEHVYIPICCSTEYTIRTTFIIPTYIFRWL